MIAVSSCASSICGASVCVGRRIRQKKKSGRNTRDLAPNRRPLRRRPGRPADDARDPEWSRDPGCPRPSRHPGSVYGRQPALPGPVPHGEYQSRAWQQRRVVFRLCLARHDRRPALRTTTRRGSASDSSASSWSSGAAWIASKPVSTCPSATSSIRGRSTCAPAAPLVRRAFNTANEIGDLTFAAYSCNNLITNLLASGEPLARHPA